MNTDVFNREHIYINTTASTQEEAYQAIAQVAYEAGYVKSSQDYYNGMWEREREATTGFQDGIAIPHAKADTCIRPGIFLMKFEQAIEWNALDGQPVHIAIALTIPVHGGEQHLKMLSRIARKLIDDDFRHALHDSTDPQTLYEVISAIEL